MVLEQLKMLSLNELIGMLSDQIASFSRGIDRLIEKNKALGANDLDELRDHITARLKSGTERAENERLLKLVDLFSADKKAIDLIRKDVDEWLDFLDAIDQHIGESGSVETEKLRKDLTKLRDEFKRS